MYGKKCVNRTLALFIIILYLMSFGGIIYADNQTTEAEIDFSFFVDYDTYIRKGFNSNDYSNETTMIVDGRASALRMGVMRFRYGADMGESTQALLTSANQITLRVRLSQNLGAPDMEIYGICDSNMKSSWQDGQMNYGTADKLGILKAIGSDDIPLIDSISLEGAAASDYLEFDVTDYVMEQAALTEEGSDAEFVFLICGANANSPNDYFRVYADNGRGTTSESNLPMLSVSSGHKGYAKKDVLNLKIDKRHQVASDFSLPAVIGTERNEGYASEIEWRSDTESVVSLEKADDVYNAYVTRPQSSKHGDAEVTLTAVISNGDVKESKSFKLYILPQGVYNPALTNYVQSNSKNSNPNSTVYAYSKGSTKYIGFVRFPFDDSTFGYAPKSVLRMKPYFMQGAFKLKMTAVNYALFEECTADMTYNDSKNIIDDEGVYTVENEQNPSQSDWIEWDVTEYINSADGDPVFRFEIESTGTAYCMMYGNAQKYLPQLKIYNSEHITDAEQVVRNAADKIRQSLNNMSSELSAVTSDISLPNTDLYGVKVIWDAVDENGKTSEYISNDGKLLKQPAYGENNVKVILKATVSREDYDGEPIVIETAVTVLSQVSDEEAVRFNENHLTLDSNIITTQGTLPKGFYNAELEWTAEPKDVIEIAGNSYKVLKRDSKTDIPVKFNAVIKKGSAEQAEKQFEALVLRDSTENYLYGVKILGDDSSMTNTNDDNILTYYASDNSFNIDYSFPNQRNIGSVVFVPYNYDNIKSVNVYTSADGTNWSLISSKNIVSEGINSITFSTVDTSYLRLSVNTEGYGGICEAGAYSGGLTTATAEDILNDTEFVKLSGIPSGSVTTDFKLSDRVKDAVVEWTSGDTNTIIISKTNSGYNAVVKRQPKTKGVKLTAVVSLNGTKAERSFTVNVAGTGESTSSSGGGGGGGGSIPKTKPAVTEKPIPTLAPTPIPTPEIPSVKEMKFTDLIKAPWAKQYIQGLFEKGIVDGRTEYEFAPNDFVTREEFVKTLITAAEFDVSGDCEFVDVEKDRWYYPYIASAVNNGIASGMDNDRFGINEKITRQDMAVMISRVLNNIQQSDNIKVFNDSDKISDYAVDAVQRLSGINIISGDENGNFNPLNNATRAEMAKIIYMMVQERSNVSHYE